MTARIRAPWSSSSRLGRLPTNDSVTENDQGNIFAFADRPASAPLPPPRTPDERPPWLSRVVWGGAAAAVVVTLVGGAVWGAAAYTRDDLCTSIGNIRASAGDLISGDSVVIPDRVLAVTGDKLADQANVLIMDSRLERAVQQLAADTARLEEIGGSGIGPAAMPQVMVLFQSVDQHFKDAQAACGMTADGLLATELGDAMVTGAKNIAASAGPIPVATPQPVPAPAYTATPDELAAAQNDVDQRRDVLADLKAGRGSTRADRAVAEYEVAEAQQRLADLRAGKPGSFHQALELKGARAYLASAQESLRQVKADPAAGDGDRAAARAEVAKWQQRVTDLAG